MLNGQLIQRLELNKFHQPCLSRFYEESLEFENFSST